MCQLIIAFMTSYKQPDFLNTVAENRFFSYSNFIDVFKQLLGQFDSGSYQFEELGKSVLNESIYKLSLGTGTTKILMWSQMHGNESTTTRSLLLFIDWFLKSTYQSNYKLYIIPVLNPDGLTRWTRENANGVDLNRDAQDLFQPESLLLRSAFDSFKPDYCFNLHDQRTIYGTPNASHAIDCSFLAPAANESREITPSRLKAMQVIYKMVHSISDHSIGTIGRYNDAFNINCVGDMFQSLGVPTILFEAGQANQDYYRLYSMNLIFKSLQSAIESLATDFVTRKDEIINNYQSITTIEANYCDILIKNVSSGDRKVDLAIMYQEVIKDEILYFVPLLSGVNDQNVKNAHRIIELKEQDVIDFDVSVGQRFISKQLDIVVFC